MEISIYTVCAALCEGWGCNENASPRSHDRLRKNTHSSGAKELPIRIWHLRHDESGCFIGSQASVHPASRKEDKVRPGTQSKRNEGKASPQPGIPWTQRLLEALCRLVV